MLALNLFLIVLRLFGAQAVPAKQPSKSLFDNSLHGQTEYDRYCTSAPQPDLAPHACFTIHDDITTAAHSASHAKLGYASSSGQDFVVVAPTTGDSKVEFFASGFWIQVRFSHSIGCARVAVWAPTRSDGRRKGDEQDAALEPFLNGVHCTNADRSMFNL
ncbi:hypothetical protein PSEUBRA_003988 [Kalmanozyma brasiliensis GHG001]|uniref:Uncharacterized protein n=1 Tax=Kalmanozyma brasiliensis (strain GHG001) TaxID=1365824 RepID=V5E779_KALBG|nr:uncharacterized protein PSEUBRA_003988 [Kalmanozyma brasiliensis GHG001]EST06121.1 hypothetical protein PSEUBRA_003988 [Kalmanozyma brasiliensis GHG001]